VAQAADEARLVARLDMAFASFRVASTIRSLSVKADTCPCRKLDPNVLVVQSARDWHGQNAAYGPDGAGYRTIFIQG
jgi:hypothetical protein